MSTVPVPRTWVYREAPSWREYNENLHEAVSWLLRPPACQVYRDSNQSVATGTHVKIQFTKVSWDTEGMWVSTANTRITPKTPGRYRATAQLGYDANAANGTRNIEIWKNGAAVWAKHDSVSGTGQNYVWRNIVGDVYMNGTTDYLELDAYQSTGSSVYVLYDTANMQWAGMLQVRWMGVN